MTTCYTISKCKYISFNRTDPKITDNVIYLTKEDTLEQMFEKISKASNSSGCVDNTNCVDSSNSSDSSNPSGCINIVIDSESPAFSDIHFNVNERNVEMNSETLKQEVLSGGTLGSSQMLEAMSTKSFVINAGRKGANIPTCHNRQNHDVLDAIAANGLLYSPQVISSTSVGKLLLHISENINAFKIYILSQYLKVESFDGVAPSTYNVPRYAVGHGEILSVFFRYISLLFFGYLTVNEIDGESESDRIYDI